ncbi:MAG: enolase C-terminal domain-like protein [Dechloromonas sp.]|nr:enolase C-terminal domain-like protein [Dechloromonas sp.]
MSDWRPYTLNLRQPWQTARGRCTQRDGQWFCQHGADGLTGWGDYAPLPEFGIDPAAAQAFAEECARLDLAAQRAGVPLNSFLSGAPPCPSIAVNDVLGAISTVDRDQLSRSSAAGFHIIKLKVGLQDVDRELRQLDDLARHLAPGQRFRLDANGAWSIAEARRFIAGSKGLPIDGLEEPLATPTQAKLAELQAEAAFALAIDESIDLLDAHFFAQRAVDRVILKPARHGLLASLALAWQSRAAGCEVIVTSALESACGLLAAAHLAAAVAPQAVHGLASGALFVENADFPLITAGQLSLPSPPGLGWQGPIVGQTTKQQNTSN